MSVYSGFSTRQQEHQYNHLTKTLLIILAKRVNKIYTQKSCNEEAFKQILLKVLCNMSLMERHKYMQPKFTENILSLVEIFSPDEFLSLTGNKTPSKVPQLRPVASQPPLIQFQKKQEMSYASDMPRPPVFYQTPLHNQNQGQNQDQENINQQIQKTQDQIDHLQSNLNLILAQSSMTKDPQRISNQSMENYNPGNLNINQDSSNHMKTHSIESSRNPLNYQNNNLRQEEVNLIENMLNLRKVEKTTKKRKLKKLKKKRCTFEKLLMEFYEDDCKDNSELMKTRDNQLYTNVDLRKNTNYLIKQARPTIRTRTNSLYR